MPSRWLRLALIVSLGVNLFLGGFIVTRWIHPDRPRFRLLPPIERVLDRIPEPQRQGVEAAVRESRAALQTEVAALKAARSRARALLQADPLDEAGLAAALDEIRARTERIQDRSHGLIVEAARNLPQEERIKLLRGRP